MYEVGQNNTKTAGQRAHANIASQPVSITQKGNDGTMELAPMAGSKPITHHLQK
jgi:hypothetical protein